MDEEWLDRTCRSILRAILRRIARKAGRFLREGRDWRLGAKISASSIPTFCFAKNPGASPFYLVWKGFRSGSPVQAFSNLLYTPATSLSDLRFCLYGGISAGRPSLTESRNPDEKVSPFIQTRNAPKGRNVFSSPPLPSKSIGLPGAPSSTQFSVGFLIWFGELSFQSCRLIWFQNLHIAVRVTYFF